MRTFVFLRGARFRPQAWRSLLGPGGVKSEVSAEQFETLRLEKEKMEGQPAAFDNDDRVRLDDSFSFLFFLAS